MKRQTRRNRYEKHRPIKLPKERPVQQPKERPIVPKDEQVSYITTENFVNNLKKYGYVRTEDYVNHWKQYGYTEEYLMRGICISHLLNNALNHGYSHSIGNEIYGWFTPISDDIIDIGDETHFDVLNEVIECVERSYEDYPLFILCNKYGWFVIKLGYSESVIPNKPCFSIYRGVVRAKNELWDSYLHQLKARTSNYIM